MLFPVFLYLAAPEEFARRGHEIYKSQVRLQVEGGNYGKIVAIDIETEAFELAKDTMTVSDRLLDRYPNTQIWCVQIGHKGVHRFMGTWALKGTHPPTSTRLTRNLHRT